jgi:hypothetical protein
MTRNLDKFRQKAGAGYKKKLQGGMWAAFRLQSLGVPTVALSTAIYAQQTYQGGPKFYAVVKELTMRLPRSSPAPEAAVQS